MILVDLLTNKAEARDIVACKPGVNRVKFFLAGSRLGQPSKRNTKAVGVLEGGFSAPIAQPTSSRGKTATLL